MLEAQNLIGAEGAVLLSGSEVNQAATSSYERTAVVHGWALARQEPRVVQNEGEAHTFLRDLAIAAENNICDLHSVVRFDGPNFDRHQPILWRLLYGKAQLNLQSDLNSQDYYLVAQLEQF